MRRRGIRLDGPVNALAVADGVAGHHHRSGRRTSNRWARRRRVTRATQWKWTHEQLVVSRARSEVHAKFAIAARGDDVRQGHNIAVLIEASAADRHTLRVIAGGRPLWLQVVDGG